VARRLTRLAVLPFRLLRSDPDVDFLAFSLADAITSSLSGLESLVVRSSLVGSKYLAESIDLRRMRDELDVDVMLTGTLLRSGDRLRVKTELVELPDGKVLWSLVSETRMGELFDLQDQLVERIVKSLPLSAADREIGRTDVPANPRAYELYLRANQMSYEAGTWEVARELYTQCLAEDPDFAPAWARLGRTHRVISKFGQDDVGRMLNEAERALERALFLNPELSLAHYLYAQLEVDIGRADRALERLLARAVKRRTDPDLFAGLVHACRYCGLLEASVAAWELARQLDPSIRTSVIHTFMARGEYERVIASRDEATDRSSASRTSRSGATRRPSRRSSSSRRGSGRIPRCSASHWGSAGCSLGTRTRRRRGSRS